MSDKPCMMPGCTEPGELMLTAALDNSFGRATLDFVGYLCTPHAHELSPVGPYSIGEGQTPRN